MGSLALSSQGTQLKIGDGAAPEVFTIVAEVRTISGPTMSLATIDTTTHDSPGNWRDFVAGLLDGGEVSFDINYVPTNATHNGTAGMLAAMKNRTKKNFKLVYPDGGSSTQSFSGYVTKFEVNAESGDNMLSASCSIKLTGNANPI